MTMHHNVFFFTLLKSVYTCMLRFYISLPASIMVNRLKKEDQKFKAEQHPSSPLPPLEQTTKCNCSLVFENRSEDDLAGIRIGLLKC